MKITAQQKYIRMSPQKIRLVAAAIKHLPPAEAQRQLAFIPKRAARPLSKVIGQAVANATNNLKLNPRLLKIESIEINEGPTLKRWRAVSRGRAHGILKQTSHIKVILGLKTPAIQVPQVEAKPKSDQTEAKSKTKTKTEAKQPTKAKAESKPKAKKQATKKATTTKKKTTKKTTGNKKKETK